MDLTYTVTDVLKIKHSHSSSLTHTEAEVTFPDMRFHQDTDVVLMLASLLLSQPYL